MICISACTKLNLEKSFLITACNHFQYLFIALIKPQYCLDIFITLCELRGTSDVVRLYNMWVTIAIILLHNRGVIEPIVQVIRINLLI